MSQPHEKDIKHYISACVQTEPSEECISVDSPRIIILCELYSQSPILLWLRWAMSRIWGPYHGRNNYVYNKEYRGVPSYGKPIVIIVHAWQ